MALGQRLSLHVAQQIKLTQRQMQVMRAIQAARAQVLESSSDAIEARLAYLVKENPALRWRGPARPRGDVVGKSFARPVDDERGPLEARYAVDDDLAQLLASAFVLERTTPDQRNAGLMIIGNLDHRGLLAATLDEIAELLEVELEDVEAAQKVVMQMEPEGCGASDVLHYLQFMVATLYPEDPWFPEMIALHLDDLRRKRFKRVSQSMEMEEEDVEEYAKMLEEIPPWPARGYGADPREHIVPTIDIVRDPASNTFKVKLKEPPKSRIMIDPRFETKLQQLEDTDQRKEALAQLEEAKAVVKQMDERSSLVARVAELAVAEQRNYFLYGPKYHRNLTMNDVAARVGVDPSSVSRAVKGRYFLFEGEVEELRSLFAHRSKPGKVSVAKLHEMIREIVANEDPRRPFTDAQLVDHLARRGVREARRTVAKHREKAGIASSRARKKRD